jgi:hypothetical protein
MERTFAPDFGSKPLADTFRYVALSRHISRTEARKYEISIRYTPAKQRTRKVADPDFIRPEKSSRTGDKSRSLPRTALQLRNRWVAGAARRKGMANVA